MAAVLGKKVRNILPKILKLRGGRQDEYMKPIIVLTPLNARRVALQNDCKIIIENMFKAHSMRRALYSSTQKNSLLTSTSVIITNLNIKLIIGLILTLRLVGRVVYIFQITEKQRYENVINVEYIEHFDN